MIKIKFIEEAKTVWLKSWSARFANATVVLSVLDIVLSAAASFYTHRWLGYISIVTALLSGFSRIVKQDKLDAEVEAKKQEGPYGYEPY